MGVASRKLKHTTLPVNLAGVARKLQCTEQHRKRNKQNTNNMKVAVIFFCLVLLAEVWAHSFMTSPPTISGNTAGSIVKACGNDRNFTTGLSGQPKFNATVGVPFVVAWPLNGHSGGTCNANLAPQASLTADQNADESLFATQTIGTGLFNALKFNATVPKVNPGKYILQWIWIGGNAGGPWYSCAFILVKLQAPVGGIPDPQDPDLFNFPDNSGSLNVLTGVLTCNTGFDPSTDANGGSVCVPTPVTPGANSASMLQFSVFGVIALIFALLF